MLDLRLFRCCWRCLLPTLWLLTQHATAPCPLHCCPLPLATLAPCRPLRSAAPSIFAGLCELFELYMLHVFIAFSDISITELQQQGSGAAAAAGGALLGGSGFGGSSGSGGGGGSSLDALTPRLRATLLRIAGDSIGKYRQLFGAQAGSKLARALGGGACIGASAVGGAPAGGAAAAGMAAGMAAAAAASSSTSQYFRRTLPSSAGSSPAPPAGVGIASQPAYPAANSGGGGGGGAAGLGAGPGSVTQPAGPQISAVSNSGNLFGLLERTAAVESLLAVAAQLQRARGALAHALPPGEAPALDAFYSRTVGAAEDLQDYVVRTGAIEDLGCRGMGGWDGGGCVLLHWCQGAGLRMRVDCWACTLQAAGLLGPTPIPVLPLHPAALPTCPRPLQARACCCRWSRSCWVLATLRCASAATLS